MENPFKLELFDKAFAYQGDIGSPLRLTFTPRHLQQPTGELVMAARHHAVPLLAVPGARYRLWYKGEFLSSGTVDLRSAEGPQGTAMVTYQLQDDFVEINSVIGWQVPGSPVTDQTSAEYKTYTGTAEKIAKDIIRDNMVTRLGKPITVATNLDRGGVVANGVKTRMDTLGELLLPMLEAAGLGIRFRNISGNKITVDCYVPVAQPLQLTEAGGQVLSYSYTVRNPTVTRVVAGGANEKKARHFDTYVSTIESDYGRIIEAFADAADLGDKLREAQNNHEQSWEDQKSKDKERDKALAEYRMSLSKYQSMASIRRLAVYRGGQALTDATADMNTANSERATALAAFINAQVAYDAAVALNNNRVSQQAAAGVFHHTELVARAKEKVAEGHPTYGFDLTLGESDNFSYGGAGVHVGDQVTVNAGGLEWTDVLRSATITYDSENGLVVTPVVGDNIESNPDVKLGRLVKKAFSLIQKLRTSR